MSKMTFGKTVFASLVGSALSFLAVGLLLIFIVTAMIGAAISGAMQDIEGGKSVSVKDQSVLHIELNDPIVERGNDKDFKLNLNTFEPEVSLGLNHILEDIDAAAGDDRIEGIFLDLSGVMGAPSTLQDVRQAIVKFKESGKWVVSYGEGYTQSAYYIASAADEVYLYPEGQMEFFGLYTELMFFKNMLDKLEIDVQIVRGPGNKYKSAVETFMLDEMSEPNREQVEAFLGDIWNQMVIEMGASRNLSSDQLNTLADNLEIGLAEEAVSNGLIDGLKYRDEIIDMLLERSGRAIEEEEKEEGEEEKKRKWDFSDDGEVRFVTLQDYHFAGGKTDFTEVEEPSDDEVAVVYAVGQIESGEGDDQTIGSDRIARALHDARLDDDVKAVVLRVNSPGGSALASDVIWRETQLIKEAGKPFVVSMGDLAASGGYYIAAGADKIYANENTITGSIGVFGIIPNMEKMFENKIGITFDRVSTNGHAGILSATRPLAEDEKEWIDEMIVDVYDEFLQRVAEGRGMTTAEVDSIAQGRVWSGTAAKKIGLVDEFGDLEDAIAEAAAMAEIENYEVKDLPRMVDPFEELLKEFGATAQMNAFIEETGVDAVYIDQMMQVKNMATGEEMIQAHMPYFFVIK
ncbi:MAG: signal peptide peptidase SppA [Flavobacteriales bacterium]|nr:signal peptide peptidase SppA [Flavobacteriales bacterium]